jgi:2-polyprenyl-6-methoxyphenol hydroxylase-like FAD-dependent oxidoreductase
MSAQIAIVGGGPSGLALAAMLERSGFDYIVYERSSKDTPPRGGCLDLHEDCGQRAMREAGVFEEFKKNSRDGDATIHRLYDHKGNMRLIWGKGRNAPEIDRWQIREILLTAIPEHKIRWSHALESAQRDAKGQVVLKFTNGHTASGFKLVVGADGTLSLIRHLVYQPHATVWNAPSNLVLLSGYRRAARVLGQTLSHNQNPPWQPLLFSNAIHWRCGLSRHYGQGQASVQLPSG